MSFKAPLRDSEATPTLTSPQRRRALQALGVLGLATAAPAHAAGMGGMMGMQGMGAIGAPVLALVADVTRPQIRSQAMALVGISIGLTFVIAILLGPMIDAAYGLNGIFILTALLALVAIVLLSLIKTEKTLAQSTSVPGIALKDLWSLHLNVFILHALLTMSFLVLPFKIEEISGYSSMDVWRFYLPVLAISLAFVAPLLRRSDKIARQKQALMTAVLGLGLTVLLMIHTTAYYPFMAAVIGFFIAFNYLEASLPALLSRLAAQHSKGASMGVYSFSQFLGMFAGGVIGGLTLEVGGRLGVSMGCFSLTVLAWLVLFKTRSQKWQEA